MNLRHPYAEVCVESCVSVEITRKIPCRFVTVVSVIVVFVMVPVS